MNYKCVFAVCLLLTLVTSWSFPVVSCLWFTLIMISFYSRLRSAFEFSLSKSTFFLLLFRSYKFEGKIEQVGHFSDIVPDC